ncbi:MAG: hypothetical protein IJ648_07570 [Lachnospiraceae bacterium]|nr:hypothetical protein [Lachnospiraceae bacterium]
MEEKDLADKKNLMEEKDLMKEKEPIGKKGRISVFIVIEIGILIIGILMSISGTIPTLAYTLRYVWTFGFAILGIVLVILLIVRIRKRFTWLIGIACIVVYLFAAGYGYIVCAMNTPRMRRLEFFEGKRVYVEIDETTYEWDGESVCYNYHELTVLEAEYYTEAHTIHIWVDDEERDYALYTDMNTSNIYVQIYGGGTGDFLVLSPD